jgi:phosphonate transport system ATP-binding protein
LVATGTDNRDVGPLELDAVGRDYDGKPAVRAVSLTVGAGEMVGIIGPSGAGKSTLLRLINRLTPPTAGAVRYAGREVSSLRGRGLRQWRADCAMIFQQFNLSGRLDTMTNVLIGRAHANPTLLNLVPWFPKTDRDAAISALARLDLLDVGLQRAETLSGGQQQRVAIARALVQEPKIILADEPVSALDPHNAERVMAALAALNREDGMTVLINLHDLAIARRHCRRIVGMRAGDVVFDGSPEALDSDALTQIYGHAAVETATATQIPFKTGAIPCPSHP